MKIQLWSSVRSIVPKAMLAAVRASRKSRRGTVVQSLSAASGSSELAMVAAAAPLPIVEASRANLAPARHKDTMFFGNSRRKPRPSFTYHGCPSPFFPRSLYACIILQDDHDVVSIQKGPKLGPALKQFGPSLRNIICHPKICAKLINEFWFMTIR